MTSKVALFIDGPNFFYVQNHGLNWFTDPKRIIDWVEDEFNGDVVMPRYYQTVSGKDRGKTLGFLTALEENAGYFVERVKCKCFNNGSHSWTESNLTIKMMLDMYSEKSKYDTAVLVSGSRDFTEVVEKLLDEHKNVVVVGTKGYMSNDLINIVGSENFVDFNEIKEDVIKIKD